VEAAAVMRVTADVDAAAPHLGCNLHAAAVTLVTLARTETQSH
jgi:hypothetical protein